MITNKQKTPETESDIEDIASLHWTPLLRNNVDMKVSM